MTHHTPARDPLEHTVPGTPVQLEALREIANRDHRVAHRTSRISGRSRRMMRYPAAGVAHAQKAMHGPVPGVRPLPPDDHPVQGIDERIGRIVAEGGLKSDREDLLDIHDGREPHPELQRDGQHLPDVPEEDVQRAEDQAEAEAEALKQREHRRHTQPRRRERPSGDHRHDPQQRHGDAEEQRGRHRVLRHENLLGDGKLLEIRRVLDEGVRAPQHAVREGGPRQEPRAEIQGKARPRPDPLYPHRHDLREDERVDQDLRERVQDVPGHSHRGARVAVTDIAQRVPCDEPPIAPEVDDHDGSGLSEAGQGRCPSCLFDADRLQLETEATSVAGQRYP